MAGAWGSTRGRHETSWNAHFRQFRVGGEGEGGVAAVITTVSVATSSNCVLPAGVLPVLWVLPVCCVLTV